MLSLDIEQLAFLVATARALETEDLSLAREPVFHRGDDGEIEVAQASDDDGIGSELRAFVNALSDEQQIELIALVWMGRKMEGMSQWADVRSQAGAGHTSRTAEYLLGIPMLSEFIEEGLSKVDPRILSALEERIASHTAA